MNVLETEFKDLISTHQTICVYGLSPDVEKPSHYVPAYMREQGWKVIGTYPKPHNVGGFKIFSCLAEVPESDRTFLNVFRGSNYIPTLVDEVLKVGGVKLLWLQLGISNPEAERRAEEAGIKVVSNRCLLVEHRRWF